MAGKKIKLQKEAISEILVANTDSESVAQAGDVEDYFGEEEDDDDNNKNKPQQKSNHRLQQVVDYQRGDCLKEGTQTFILLSVQHKV